MILQLNPPLPLETPKGSAWAHFLIDHGQEHHLLWVTFIESTGECWNFENPDIRMQHNMTLGRPKQEYAWPKRWISAKELTEVVNAKN